MIVKLFTHHLHTYTYHSTMDIQPNRLFSTIKVPIIRPLAIAEKEDITKTTLHELSFSYTGRNSSGIPIFIAHV